MSIRSISPSDVYTARRAGSAAATLLDVRTPAEYGEVHAQGAKLLPLDRLDPRQVVAARGPTSDAPIYLICKSGSRAAKAFDKFTAAGINNVLCVDGGTDAWLNAGLPVVRGRKTLSLERQVRIVAGLLILLGIALGRFVHPLFLGLSAFVGAGLVFAGITDWCGMGMLLARMPWNQRGSDARGKGEIDQCCRRDGGITCQQES